MKKAFKSIDLFGKLLFVLLLICAVLGDGFHFYQKFFWWDLLAHCISGACFVCIGVGLFRMLPAVKTWQLLLFACMLSISLQVFWEMIEFVCDLSFGWNMQRWHYDPKLPDTYGRIINWRTPGVIDTMTDFTANIAGALAASMGYCLYFRIAKKKRNNVGSTSRRSRANR